MESKKTATLTMRIDPELKSRLGNRAKRQRRSLANFIHNILEDYVREDHHGPVRQRDEGTG